MERKDKAAARRDTMTDKRLSFFLPFGKVEKTDDGCRMVSGYASTPTLDLDGEIITLDCVKAALPDYMEWRNVRQMHQPLAVGVAKEANVDDIGLFLRAKIVDPACVKLIDEDVLKGFSVGGKKLKQDGNTITQMELIEISVVDRPANPDCKIEVMKGARHVGKRIELVKTVTTKAAEPTFNREEVGFLGRLLQKMSGGGEHLFKGEQSRDDHGRFSSGGGGDKDKDEKDKGEKDKGEKDKIKERISDLSTSLASAYPHQRDWIQHQLRAAHEQLAGLEGTKGILPEWLKREKMFGGASPPVATQAIENHGELGTTIPTWLKRDTMERTQFSRSLQEALNRVMDESVSIEELRAGINKRDVSDKERSNLADQGKALPDGSFPIATKSDLENAISAFGRAKNKARAKRHIVRRAKALGATDMLPADWPGSTKDKEKVAAAKAQIKKGANFYTISSMIELLGRLEWAEECCEGEGGMSLYGGSETQIEVGKDFTDKFGALLVEFGDMIADLLDRLLSEMADEEREEAAEEAGKVAKRLRQPPVRKSIDPPFDGDDTTDVVAALAVLVKKNSAAAGQQGDAFARLQRMVQGR